MHITTYTVIHRKLPVTVERDATGKNKTGGGVGRDATRKD